MLNRYQCIDGRMMHMESPRKGVAEWVLADAVDAEVRAAFDRGMAEGASGRIDVREAVQRERDRIDYAIKADCDFTHNEVRLIMECIYPKVATDQRPAKIDVREAVQREQEEILADLSEMVPFLEKGAVDGIASGVKMARDRIRSRGEGKGIQPPGTGSHDYREVYRARQSGKSWVQDAYMAATEKPRKIERLENRPMWAELHVFTDKINELIDAENARRL